MAAPKIPVKALLILSLVVLALHLALLQTLPLRLNSQATDTPALSFATRTLTPDPPPKAAHVSATKPIPRAAPKPPPPMSPLPTEPTPASISTAEQTHAETAPAETASVEPLPAEPPTPQPTASTPVDPEEIPAARPPKELATAFSIDGMPGSVKLVYKVLANKFPYTLHGELIWQLDDGRYEASLSFGAFGQSRTQKSRGSTGPEGLSPERFSDKFRSEVAAHFNRDQGKVTFSANTPDVALLSGAQDRLSVLIQLAAIAASNPTRLTPGTTLTLQTVGPRDADLWLFTVGEMETLGLPGGQTEGIKLTRNPRQPYDQHVSIWLAPSLSYLPARIRIQEANGDYIDQQWVATETP
ncbi:MAG: hypothetical protein FD135_1138 [Comamonadaceae bacterium]|nr:MAG: hypothetical protein FD135_1138 [Comamonadaceae bacterium]